MLEGQSRDSDTVGRNPASGMPVSTESTPLSSAELPTNEIKPTVADRKNVHQLTSKNLLSELGELAEKRLPASAFPNFGLYLAYKIDSLASLEPAQRFSIINRMVSLYEQHKSLTPRQQSLFYKAFSHLTNNERVRLIRKLSNKLDETEEPKLIRQLTSLALDSCPDRKALTRCVAQLGAGGLYESGNLRTKNVVAFVEISKALQKVPLPRPLAKNTPAPKVNKQLQEIKKVLEERLATVKRQHPFLNTTVGHRYKKILQNALVHLDHDRRRTHGVANRRALANMYIKKINIETSHNIEISNERNASGTSVVVWTQSTLKSLEKALAALPERLITVTPKLAQLRLVSELNQAYGQRDGTGLVKIATNSIKDSSIYTQYKGHDSLKLVILHELGHSIKFGPYSDGPQKKHSISDLSKQSNPVIDLADFMKISDWRVVDPSLFKVTNGGQSILLAGKHFALGDPAAYNDTLVIFRYDGGKQTLYSHDAAARFPVQSYGRYNPWEDFTESLTDYTFIPERLIEFAPWKFVYFEQRFRRHATNERVMQALYRELPELGGRL